ncbi:MAG: phytoene/squalene synthase family protein [Rhodospirillales bacterium]|jgi:phytoene synthase|nr:phytoene/squalene synthase family protein [Rhodospirillales bacterium]
MPDLSFCAQQVRRQDNDRFLCALFAPPERREWLFALYAFNLELAAIPDKVSELPLGRMRLQWWREAVEGDLKGPAARHEVARPLARAIAETPLAAQSLLGLIDSREIDLNDQPPIRDLDAIEGYAASTAGALADMSLDVLGVGDPAARDAARHVGVACAGLGIIRSIPFHAARRRLYLPTDSLRAAGLTVEEIFAGTASPKLRRVVIEIADWSRQHLKVARGGCGELPAMALPALLPAVLADIHLERLRGADFNPFDRKIARPAPWRVARLWLHARRGRF